MEGFRIITIGASAGGVEALKELVQYLPANLPAPVLIVLHVPAFGTSVLPHILNRVHTLPAIHPQSGQGVQPGQIYVAPPNRHLLLQPGLIQLSAGPRVNGHRPAIDPLFQSAALAYGARVVGVVLSGTLDDGTVGLEIIKRCGGIAIAQDPTEALYPGMPQSAIQNVAVDYVLKLAEMAQCLTQLAHQPLGDNTPNCDLSSTATGEGAIAEPLLDPSPAEPNSAKPSGFVCPECGGTLWELPAGDLLQFRCHTGHTFSPDTLLAQQSDNLDTALWTALRALEEQSTLARRMAKRAKGRNYQIRTHKYMTKAQEAEQSTAQIRELLLSEVNQSEVREATLEQDI